MAHATMMKIEQHFLSNQEVVCWCNKNCSLGFGCNFNLVLSIERILFFTSHPIRFDLQANKNASRYDTLKLYREEIGRCTDCCFLEMPAPFLTHLLWHSQVEKAGKDFFVGRDKISWKENRSHVFHVIVCSV